MDQLKATGVEELLTQALLVLGLLVVLVIAVLVLVVYSKYQALPAAGKFLVSLVVAVAGVIVALITGMLAEQQLAEAWGWLTEQVQHYWRLYDGWARTHPVVGVLLLAAIPIVYLTGNDRRKA